MFGWFKKIKQQEKQIEYLAEQLNALKQEQVRKENVNRGGK